MEKLFLVSRSFAAMSSTCIPLLWPSGSLSLRPSPKKFVSSLHQSSKTGSKHRDAKYSTSSLSCRILCTIFPIYLYIFIRYISLYSSHFFPFSHEVYYILSHAMATSLRECTSSYFFVPFQRPRPAAAATATAI